MDKLDLMLEADKRGMLPPDQKAYLDEAMKRGLVKAVPTDIRSQGAQLATDDTPTWQKGLVSIGRGLTDVGQGAKQIYLHAKDAITAPTMKDLVLGNRESDRYDAEVADELARFKPFEDSVSGASIGRATGASLPTLLIPGGAGARVIGGVVGKAAPAIGAKLAGSALTDAAAIGAGQGALNVTDQGQSHLGNALAGAAGGTAAVLGMNGLLKAATPVIRQVLEKISPTQIAKGAFTPETAALLARQGIDVASLTQDARDNLSKLAQNAVQGSATTPAELARQARLESLPVPFKPGEISKGQLTRDFAQNQTEQDLLKNNAVGAPLRSQRDLQEQKLLDNFDTFKAQTGANARSEGDVGRSVSEAMQARIDQSQANVSSLYREAEKKGELNGPVSLDPLAEYLNKNPGINPYAESQLKSMKMMSVDKEGNLTPTGPTSLNDLERIRRRASTVSATSSDGTMRNDAKGLVKFIDGMIPADAGGDAYRAARAARTNHAMQFEEPGVIQDVVGMSSRTDRSVPLEDVFNKTVVNGSIDDLRTLKAQLMSYDNKDRAAGVQAVNNLKGQAIQMLKDAATNNAQGTTSEAGLRRAFNKIDPEKWDLLLGSTNAKQLRNFVDAVNDLKVPPTGTTNASGTGQSIINWLDRILGSVGGSLGRGTGKAVQNLVANGKAAAQVEEAVNPIASREAANSGAIDQMKKAKLSDLLKSPGMNRARRIGAALGASAGAQQ